VRSLEASTDGTACERPREKRLCPASFDEPPTPRCFDVGYRAGLNSSESGWNGYHGIETAHPNIIPEFVKVPRAVGAVGLETTAFFFN